MPLVLAAACFSFPVTGFYPGLFGFDRFAVLGWWGGLLDFEGFGGCGGALF